MKLRCWLLGHKFRCEKCGEEAAPALWTKDLDSIVDVMVQAMLSRVIADVGRTEPEVAFRFTRALMLSRSKARSEES